MEKKHYNETLEQRKKAQAEFIKLKQMEAAGEQYPDDKERIIKSTTVAEKSENFWYHYKVHVFLISFVVLFMSIGIWQCAKKPKYDAQIVLRTNCYYTDRQIELVENYLLPYFTDINGDGEVKIQVVDCSYNTDGTFDSQYVTGLAQKLQAYVSSEPSVQLYLFDERTLQMFNDWAKGYDGFFAEYEKLPDDFYAAVNTEDFTFPENMMIGRRLIVDGMTVSSSKKIGEYTENAANEYNEITKK